MKKLSIASLLSKKSTSRNERNACSERVRARALRLESLESRELLSVAPGSEFLAADSANTRDLFDVVYESNAATPDDFLDLSQTLLDPADAANSDFLTEGATALVVTSAADVVDANDGVLTLREALTSAESGALITFDASLKGKTIALDPELGQLTTSKSLTIDASNLWDATTSAPGLAISGQGASGILYLAGSADVEINGITFTNGYSDGNGGAICISSATLSLVNCYVTNNFTKCYGGAVYVATGSAFAASDCVVVGNDAKYGGGGVYSDAGETTFTNCAITNNSASTFGGGGIAVRNDAVLAMTNCLVAGNSAPYGAGLDLWGGNTTLYNCTVTDNTASICGGVNLDAPSVLNAYNTIIAGNSVSNTGADVYSYDAHFFGSSNAVANAYNTLSSFSGWTSGENNLTYDASNPLFTNAESGDYTLAENSQAINKGNNQYVTTNVDLVGNARISSGTVDLGAYEFQFKETPSTVVTTADDVVDSYDGKISLREALDYAESGATITFDASLQGKTIALELGQLETNKTLTISASNLWDESASAPGLTIDGQGASRILYLNGDFEVVINGITFTNGYVDSADDDLWKSGGAIFSYGTTLSLNSCVISASKAYRGGGAFFYYSEATLANCVVTNNTANFGGAIHNESATLSLDNCTICDNEAKQGGAIYNYKATLSLDNCVISDNETSSSGGGVCSYDGETTLTNCIITNNTATKGDGGAILSYMVHNEYSTILSLNNCLINDNKASGGGGVFAWGGVATLSNCNVTNNASTRDFGGAIYNFSATLALNNCSISDNNAKSSGGGVFSSYGETTLTNCIVTNNIAGDSGAGICIYCNANSNAVFNAYNSIIVNNSTSLSSADFYFYSSNATANAYNTLSSFSNWNNGANNLTYDATKPLFTNATTCDYTLAANSQAINKGNNQYVTTSVDLAGNARVSGGTVDLGAYEFQNSQLDAPTNLRETAKTETTVTVAWDAVLGATGYRIAWRNKADSANAYVSLDASKTSYKLTGLDSGASYYWKVQALGDGVDYNTSAFTSARTVKPRQKLASPSLAADSEPTAITVSWTAVPNALRYYVSYKLASETEWSSNINAGTNLSYTINGLDPNAEYDVRVKAIGDSFDYATSDFATVTVATQGMEPETPSIVVTTNLDVVNSYDGVISLREALDYAESGATITFVSSLKGKTIALELGQLETSKSIIIDASNLLDASTSAPGLAISGQGASRILYVTPGDVVAVNGIAFANGFAGDYGDGGAIYNYGGSLFLENCVIRDSEAYKGGGLHSAYGYATLVNCILTNNTAGYYGGAIYDLGGTLSLVDCVISDNEAFYGGGAAYCAGNVETFANCVLTNNSGNTGGAIYNYSASLSLNNCAISGGEAYYGGAVYGATVSLLTASNCLVAENDAFWGGGLYLNGSATLYNCSIVGNKSNFYDQGYGVNENYGGYGGGVELDGTAVLNAHNSIITGNSASRIGADVYLNGSNVAANASNTLSSYSDWTNSENNLIYNASQPLFTNAAAGDYTLANNSQAIDKGSDLYVTARVDFAGNKRASGISVDLGAYEYQFDSDLETLSTPVDVVCAASEGVIDVSWEATPNASGYRIAYRTSDNWYTTVDLASNQTDYSITGLPPGETYYVKVAALGDGTTRRTSYYSTETTVRIPTVIVVSSDADVVDDGDGVVTLREALANAQTNDIITFDDSLKGKTIELDSQLGRLTTKKAVTIDASNLLDASTSAPGLTISGQGASGILYLNEGADVEIDGITFTNGYANGTGGAIYVYGATLSLNNCAVTNNAVTSLGGAIYVASSSVFTATNCLVAGNAAINGGGLALYGKTTLYNCTIVCNTAKDKGGGVFLSGAAVLNAYNTIIAGNSASSGPNVCCFISTAVANAYNTLSDYAAWANGENNLTYSAAKQLFTNAEAGDYTLADDSQAINKGNNQYATATVDLAGNPRVFDGTVDLGAYEYQKFKLAAPTNRRETAKTETTVTVAWDAVENASGYRLAWRNKTDSTFTVVTIDDAATTSYKLTRLANDASYVWKVQALGDGDVYADSDYSATRTVKPRQKLATPTVSYAVEATSISVLWNAVAHASSYRVTYQLADGSTKTANVDASTTSHTFANLSPNTTYAVKVVAFGDKFDYSNSDPALFSVALLETPEARSTVVTTADDVYNVYDGLISLREALDYAESGATIAFADFLDGATIALDPLVGELATNKSITVDASNLWDADNQTPGLTISGQNASRILRLDEGADVEINAITFANGYTGESGGAVYNGGATLSLNNCVVRDSEAFYGGGIYSDGGETTLVNCSVTNNAAVGSGDAQSCGGGVGGANATLTIVDCAISENTACRGAGVYSENGETTLNNCALTNNDAFRTDPNSNLTRGYGGAVYNNGATLSIVDCSISDNVANTDGGGVYSLSGETSLVNCNLTNNTATEWSGGAVYSYDGKLTLTNCVVENNSAPRYAGGGIYSRSGETTLDNCSFTNNVTANWGGGVYNYDATLTLSDCIINGNEANLGGGVRARQGVVTLVNCTVTNNTANDYGGGICNYDATLCVNDCAISGNKASRFGGGVYTESGETALSNCEITNNIATPIVTDGVSSDAFGGGICNSQATVSLDDCVISGNITSSYGGGVYTENGEMTLSNCKIMNNIAGSTAEEGVSSGGTGGGISNYNTTISLVDCVINGNKATWAGGLFTGNGFATLDSCTITDNEASFGGGIYVYFDSDSVLAATNCLVAGNVAKYDGAGFYCYKGSATLHNCTITDNTASNSGGGVAFSDGTVRLDAYNTIVAGNGASSSNPDVYFSGSNAVANAYSTLSSFSNWNNGANNLTYDPAKPLFTDATSGDYTLAANSQALDKGDNQYVTTSADLAGKARISGGTVDLGTYERQVGPVQLDAPVLSVTAKTGTTLTLSWDEVANAERYSLSYRLAGETTWNNVNVGTNLSYTITGLDMDAEYDLRLKAVGDGTNYKSAYSAIVRAETTAMTQLDAPVPTVTAKTATSITAAWSEVPNAIGYQFIWKNQSDSSYTVVLLLDATKTSYTLAGLDNSAVYVWKVLALGDNGYGYLNSEYCATQRDRPQQTLPAPTLTVAAATDSLTLSWSAVANAVRYSVSYKRADETTWTNKNVGANLSYTIEGLDQNTEYDVRIRTIGDGVNYKNSGYSATVRAATESTVIQLDAPIVTVDAAQTSLTVSWSDVPNADRFSVSYKLAGETAWTNKNVGTNLSYTITGLESNTEYDVRVKAVGDGVSYKSSYSEIVRAKTESTTQLDAPVPSVAAKTATSITAAWSEVPNATGYRFIWKNQSDAAYTVVLLDATTTSHTLAGLDNSAVYVWKVLALGDNVAYLNSEYCATQRDKPQQTLAAPTLIVAATTDSLTLSWNAVANAVRYSVSYKRADETTWTNKNVGANLSYMIEGLDQNTEYDARVRAIGDGVNYKNSGYSATVRAKTEASVIQLDSPTVTVAAAQTSLTVSWDAVPNADRYSVSYKLATESTWTNKNVGTNLNYTISGLESDTEYDVRVKAVGDGVSYKSSYSAIVRAKTETAATPDAPTQLAAPVPSVAAKTATSITATWNAVPNAIGYRFIWKNQSDASYAVDYLNAATTSYTFTELDNGAVYVWKVLALGDGVSYLNSEYCATQRDKPQQTLKAPTLTVSAAPASLTLNWSAVPNAERYSVAYKLADATTWTNKNVGTNISYVITGLTRNTGYELRLKAVGDDVNYKSVYSAIVSAQTTSASSSLLDLSDDLFDELAEEDYDLLSKNFIA